MEKIKLGNSDVTVSPICLGCMGFGKTQDGLHAWAIGYEPARDIIKNALDAGINYFDTAPVYNNGTSEEILGEALKELQVPREKVVIASKYYPRSPQEIEAGISAEEHIRTWLDGSLQRLQTDYMDHYILHMWDWNTDIEEILTALDKLVKEGKVKAIGLANAYAWQAAKANEIARAKGLTPFVSVQNQWNLISREDEREMVPYAMKENIALTPYASLAGGRLSKRPGQTSKRLELDAYGAKKFGTQKEADGKVVEALIQTSDELNASMTETALAWLMAKGAIPIAGATKAHHVQGLVNAVTLNLTDEQMARLEENYVPHVLTGVLAEHTPDQDPYAAYLGGKDPFGPLKETI